jgi:hypothetical protein
MLRKEGQVNLYVCMYVCIYIYIYIYMIMTRPVWPGRVIIRIRPNTEHCWVAYKAPTTPWIWQPFAETCRGRMWNALIKSTTSLSICWSFYNDTTRCSVQPSRICELLVMDSVVSPGSKAHALLWMNMSVKHSKSFTTHFFLWTFK